MEEEATDEVPEIEPEPEKTKHHNGRSNCPIILETYSTDVMEDEAIANEILELEELGFLNNNGRSNCPIILETYSTDVMEEEATDEVPEIEPEPEKTKLELEELGFLDDASRPCDEQTGAPTVGHAVALTEYHTCLRCGKVCSR